jgi:hypothetical protein
MAHNLSSRLIELLGPNAFDNLRAATSLAALAGTYLAAEGLAYPGWLSIEALPTIPIGSLLSYLHQISAHDSVVQDVGTTGHLGKLLVRWDVLVRTNNYELLGLPNPKLDALSKRDRMEFFDSRVSLNRLSSAALQADVEAVVERERNW